MIVHLIIHRVPFPEMSATGTGRRRNLHSCLLVHLSIC